jgi:uncharacterized membrane protein YkgB
MSPVSASPSVGRETSPRGEDVLAVRLAHSCAVERLDALAGAVLRYGLVAIILFFGAFKFTAVEAAGIQPLVAHSPVLAWLYRVGSLGAVSNGIGLIEIAIALLIAMRRFSPSLAAVGSIGAAFLFATTVSFAFSTPGVWVSVPGFPVPVPNGTGAFLVKDVFLFGAAVWSAAESLRALRRRSAATETSLIEPESSPA